MIRSDGLTSLAVLVLVVTGGWVVERHDQRYDDGNAGTNRARCWVRRYQTYYPLHARARALDVIGFVGACGCVCVSVCVCARVRVCVRLGDWSMCVQLTRNSRTGQLSLRNAIGSHAGLWGWRLGELGVSFPNGPSVCARARTHATIMGVIIRNLMY